MKTRYLFLAALVAGTAACGGSQALDSATEATTEAATEATTEVAEEAVEEVAEATMMNLRVVNVCAADASVTVGAVAMDASAPGTYNQTRVETIAGEQQLAGTVGAMALADSYTFEADGDYTVVIMGDPTSANMAIAPHAMVFEDELAVPNEGQARVRFINAGFGMDNIAVTVNGVGLATDLAYGTASDYHAAPGVAADVVVSIAGQDIATENVTFLEGRIYTIIGTPAEGGMDFVVINEPAAE